MKTSHHRSTKFYPRKKATKFYPNQLLTIWASFCMIRLFYWHQIVNAPFRDHNMECSDYRVHRKYQDKLGDSRKTMNKLKEKNKKLIKLLNCQTFYAYDSFPIVTYGPANYPAVISSLPNARFIFLCQTTLFQNDL